MALGECYELFPVLGIARASAPAASAAASGRCWPSCSVRPARPKLMLLDEPSAGLSPFVTEVFRMLRRATPASRSSSSSRMRGSVLRWCDYAYLLREGQIAFQGAAADLLADEETVKSYLGVKITHKDAVPT